MSSHLPRNILTGLSCPSCQYDLRGSTSLVCPECGCKVNPHAQLMTPPERDPLPLLGVVATLFTVFSCGYVVWLATHYALGFVELDWGAVNINAAQSVKYHGLIAFIPLLFILPLVGTCVACFARIGFRVARCCTIALIGYWVACCCLIG